jgi:tetratricopeptide (TPR) repeat protein
MLKKPPVPVPMLATLDPLLLGHQLRDQGQLAAATQAYQEAIALQPDRVEAYNELANLWQRRGEAQAAIDCFQQAIALQPQAASLHYNLGTVFHGQGQLDLAAASYRQAIALQPQFGDAYNNLGTVLRRQGQPAAAITLYQQALALQLDSFSLYNNLGNAYRHQGDLAAAIAAYRQALALEDHAPDTYLSLGDCYSSQGQIDRAIAAYERALELRPDRAQTHSQLGNLLREQGQIDLAIAAYQKALSLQPHYPNARYNLAFALLTRGDLAPGWEEYQWRFATDRPVEKIMTSPPWAGELGQDLDLLLWGEQGLGDGIQFVRYAPLLQSWGLKLTLAVHPALVNLFQTCLIQADQPRHPIRVVDRATLDRASTRPHLPLMSLPYRCGTTLANIPAALPYLRLPEAINPALQLPTAPLRLGIVWGTSATNGTMYHRKTIPLDTFLAGYEALANRDALALYSLQVGPDAGQIQPWLGRGNIYDYSDRLGDFVATAQVIGQLDLVITVDTAVAHLAGALGKPVWVLIPQVADWRWLRDRADSPWYATMRLFRQAAPGDWASTCAELWRSVAAEWL